MSKIGFVYKITSKCGKFYIGRTIDPERRMSEHFKTSWATSLKYKPDKMKVEILERVPLTVKIPIIPCVCGRDRPKYDLKHLLELETDYIKKYADKNMLNIIGNPLQ